MKIFKLLTNRAAYMLLMALMEIILLTALARNFAAHLAWIEGALRLFSVVIVLQIIRTSRHLSSDLMWILLIILFPVPGTFMYLLLGANLILSRTLWNLVKSTADSRYYYEQNSEILREMKRDAPPCADSSAISPTAPDSLSNATPDLTTTASAKPGIRSCWRKCARPNASFFWNTSSSRKGKCGTAFWKFWKRKPRRVWTCA